MGSALDTHVEYLEISRFPQRENVACVESGDPLLG